MQGNCLQTYVLLPCLSHIYRPTVLDASMARLSTLTAILAANVSVMKYGIDNSRAVQETERVAYTVPKFHQLWSTNHRL